jgi:hypothetical protein
MCCVNGSNFKIAISTLAIIQLTREGTSQYEMLHIARGTENYFGALGGAMLLLHYGTALKRATGRRASGVAAFAQSGVCFDASTKVDGL